MDRARSFNWHFFNGGYKNEKSRSKSFTAAKGVLREALREVCLFKLQRVKLFYGYHYLAHSFAACQSVMGRSNLLKRIFFGIDNRF